jgi:hypothetical protein
MELSDKLQIIALPLEIVGFFLAALEMYSRKAAARVEKFLDDFEEYFSRLNFNIDSPNSADGSFVFAIGFVKMKEAGEYEQLELFYNPSSYYHLDPNFLSVGVISKALVLIYSITTCLPIINSFDSVWAKILVSIFIIPLAVYILSVIIMFLISTIILVVRGA